VLGEPGAIVTAPGGAVAGDGGPTLDLHVGGAQVLGSTGDVDGDGRAELPYVDGSGDLLVNDSTGEVQTLVDRSAVTATARPDTDKSLMATGSWQGSPTSVFYADTDHAEIYRIAPGGSPILARDLSGNGVNSVLGVGDIDGDGDDELVYPDGSREIRYVDIDRRRGPSEARLAPIHPVIRLIPSRVRWAVVLTVIDPKHGREDPCRVDSRTAGGA